MGCRGDGWICCLEGCEGVRRIRHLREMAGFGGSVWLVGGDFRGIGPGFGGGRGTGVGGAGPGVRGPASLWRDFRGRRGFGRGWCGGWVGGEHEGGRAEREVGDMARGSSQTNTFGPSAIPSAIPSARYLRPYLRPTFGRYLRPSAPFGARLRIPSALTFERFSEQLLDVLRFVVALEQDVVGLEFLLGHAAVPPCDVRNRG